MKAIQDMVEGALALPLSAIPYTVGRRLHELLPGRAILESGDYDFTVENFAKHGGCELTRVGTMHAVENWVWYGGTQTMSPSTGTSLTEVLWGEEKLLILRVVWVTSCGEESRRWVVAASDEVAQAFFKAVCSFSREVHAEVFVFEEGYWDRSEDLFKSVRNSTLDTLILPAALKDELLRDARSFFASKETYLEHGIPWKRGILLLGPPGNGKTHAIKGLVNALDLPCLYAKVFHIENMSDSRNIKAVFEHARAVAPCVLVLEDLDSLVTDENRSFFLNELDGFASNNGIFTIATTNHPDRLDPAIVDRPSRFDRKYHFTLPDAAERRAYFAQWKLGLKPALHASEASLDQACALTEGFSFAYLKELTVSALVRWFEHRTEGTMDELLLACITLLREQMISHWSAAPQGAEETSA